jgi:hypothetical protein
MSRRNRCKQMRNETQHSQRRETGFSQSSVPTSSRRRDPSQTLCSERRKSQQRFCSVPASLQHARGQPALLQPLCDADRGRLPPTFNCPSVPPASPNPDDRRSNAAGRVCPQRKLARPGRAQMRESRGWQRASPAHGGAETCRLPRPGAYLEVDPLLVLPVRGRPGLWHSALAWPL